MDANVMKISTAVHDNNTQNTNENKDIKDNIKVENTEVHKTFPLNKKEKTDDSNLEAEVIKAIEKANKAFSSSNRMLEFSIHEKTKEIMVKVVDSETKEVIREIPPEKILDMVAKLCELAGIMFDESR